MRALSLLALLGTASAAISSAESTKSDTDGGGSVSETSDVYTYFTPGVTPSDKELEAIQLWNSSWTLAGWRTHVVGPDDAVAHPQYKVRQGERLHSSEPWEWVGAKERAARA